MQHPLLETQQVDTAPSDYLGASGRVFTTFGPETQDSGNLSYGIEVEGARFFVKTTDPDADVLLDHSTRVLLLRNAVKIARRCPHPVLPELLNVIESPDGPMLVYRWVEGELLRARQNPAAHERFRALDVAVIIEKLDEVIALHTEIVAAGYVAVDFYDGCLIYDFRTGRIHVVDLDHYELGAFRNAMGRMFGSSRFMAPEEFEYGALIDERTTLFNMGRMIAIFLADGSLQPARFSGGRRLHEVVVRACEPRPENRFSTMAEFYSAWGEAR